MSKMLNVYPFELNNMLVGKLKRYHKPPLFPPKTGVDCYSAYLEQSKFPNKDQVVLISKGIQASTATLI